MSPDPAAGIDPGGRRLTRAELAREADTTVDRIDRFVTIGAIRAEPDGTFTPGDVLRATLVEAFVAAGVSLDHIELGIRERLMAFDFADLVYRLPGPRSSRTFAEFAAAQGERGAHLPGIIAALGLVQPESARPLTIEEEDLLSRFLVAWDLGGGDTPERAARIVGDAAAHVADGWVGIFSEMIPSTTDGGELTLDELVPQIVVPASRVADLVYPLVAWLLGRHFERAQNQLNVDTIEAALVRRGLVPDRQADPPAIAFADLAGYTRLTEELGDEGAARAALRLADLAVDAARAHDGRLVKLLGDGVMLHFRRPAAAVTASLDLVDAVAAARLPPAHVGIDAGRVIARDGDYFGHTVNLASRISGRASAGEVLVSADLVDAVGAPAPEPGFIFDGIGPATLKGISEPVELYRARRPTPPVR